MRQRGAAAKVLRVAPEAKVCARGFVNQVGRAVCGIAGFVLIILSALLDIADLGPTFRDLSIVTPALCALFENS